MKFFTLGGVLFLIIGLAFTLAGYNMLNDSGVTFKAFMAGPIMMLVALGMMFFPGEITAKQIKSKEIDPKQAISLTPIKNKIIWGAFGVVGFIVSNFIF